VKDGDFPSHELSNLLEGLSNLLYLIDEEAEDSGKVRQYTHQSQERLTSMIILLRSEDALYTDLHVPRPT
jgi:hypothetical protein